MTCTLAWLHNLSPFLVQIADGVGLRWYGISYALGFVSGWAILRWFAIRGLTPMSPARVSDAMLTLVMGVVIGGRLGYCLFYQPSLLTSFTGSFPFWGVLRLHEGGMASHGGMVGVLAACWWIARKGRDKTGPVPVLHVTDLMALACTPGLFLGRLANFVNGELLGKIAAMPGEPAPWWAVKFPQEAFTGHAPPGQDAALHKLLAVYRLGDESDADTYDRLLRVLQSGGRGAADIAAKLEPLLSARHPSQLYQAAAEGLVMGLFLLLVWRRPRPAGVVSACFLAGYGVLRILTEFVRLPDANLAVQRIMGLSRGQWLSVAMILAGVAMAAVVLLRPGTLRFGGWGRPAKPTTESP